MSRSLKRQRTSRYSTSSTRKKKFNFECLPPEVLEMVLRFIPYQHIAARVRLVSRYCCSVATTFLNAAFLSVGNRLCAMQRKLSELPEPIDKKWILATRCNCYNLLETLRARYEIVRAVVWRYTHPPRSQEFDRICFYGGDILDELDAFIAWAWTASTSDSSANTKYPKQRLADFMYKSKLFMDYFEKVSESRVNSKRLFPSGCKIVDLLDCLGKGRKVKSLRTRKKKSERGPYVKMKIRYVLERSWYTCVDLPRSYSYVCRYSWRERQRFMYMRLRRLVWSVNEQRLQLEQYRRAVLTRATNFLPFPAPPSCDTFLGYGEHEDKFYFYGSMNKYERRISNRNVKLVVSKKPRHDLVIDVKLKCSLDLVPLAVRSFLKCDDFENARSVNNYEPELYLKLDVNCSASAANKLPNTFTWEIRNSRHSSYSYRR